MKRLKLIELREKMGLTQDEFADRIQISRGHYSNIETGLRNPSFHILCKIAAICNKSIDEIFLQKNASSGRKNAS